MRRETKEFLEGHFGETPRLVSHLSESMVATKKALERDDMSAMCLACQTLFDERISEGAATYGIFTLLLIVWEELQAEREAHKDN